ncbi:hypothetical protein [Amycolatopsis regifaucium]|uniref:Uncharacterized protein n=1 Tax=Amycolatopsis regifaucium TaxID=546365 RepID=A0A154MFY3_9PSEU|nr:hypothetical protein [Amycolatopsis regifaucium]KZB83418.1 hypothetical protein AVL48_04580 [Amycolatopsis regifaucium]OKA08883.1 hypothetical protein ATP06_0211045 [Amycolatopsis regifaucium]
MTDAVSRTIDAMRVGRLLARALVVVCGIFAATAVAWIVGDVTARADTLVVDGRPESGAPVTAVEVDPSLSAARVQVGDPADSVAIQPLREFAASSLPRRSESVVALLDRAVVSVENLDETAKSTTNAVTRRAVEALDVSASRQPADVDRTPAGVTSSFTGVPASKPATASSGLVSQDAADGTRTLSSPCGHKARGEYPSGASRFHGSVRATGESVPPWSPVSRCGTSTSVAAACGGDHGGGAVVPVRTARNNRISPHCGEIGHQAALATVIRPGVTPG